eukprot:Gb_13418 [translate_table: standard]
MQGKEGFISCGENGRLIVAVFREFVAIAVIYAKVLVHFFVLRPTVRKQTLGWASGRLLFSCVADFGVTLTKIWFLWTSSSGCSAQGMKISLCEGLMVEGGTTFLHHEDASLPLTLRFRAKVIGCNSLAECKGFDLNS